MSEPFLFLAQAAPAPSAPAWLQFVPMLLILVVFYFLLVAPMRKKQRELQKRVKDETSGQEVTEETLLSEYKAVQGTKQATKFIVKRDGKLYSEGEISDYQLTEKLDDALFAKP